MKITGACHCGKITYEADVSLDKVVVCHCIDCQKISGTAFRSVVMSEPNGVTFTKGTAKEYVKIAESGNPRAQGFCADCGSALYATTVEKENRVYGIRAGNVDQRNKLIPKCQIWHSSAVPWLNTLESLPAFEKSPK